MTTVRVGGYAPRDSSHSRAVTLFRDELRRALGDEVEVDIVWNILDQGRPAPDLLDMVENGELTLCYFSTSYLGKRVPELDVLEVPFLFESLSGAHASLDGALGAALTAATERRTGFAVLGYWDNGFRHLTNRLRPIRTPADVAGMRVRLQPNRFHEAMVKAWGATPVPVELRAGIAMITAGEVDAQENPLANTVAYGVDRVHRFATMTGHLYGARGLYANQAEVAGWTPRIRAAVYAAARSAIVTQRTGAREKEAELRVQLEDAGMQFEDLSDSERDGFVAATAKVIDMAHIRLDPSLFESLET